MSPWEPPRGPLPDQRHRGNGNNQESPEPFSSCSVRKQLWVSGDSLEAVSFPCSLLDCVLSQRRGFLSRFLGDYFKVFAWFKSLFDEAFQFSADSF